MWVPQEWKYKKFSWNEYPSVNHCQIAGKRRLRRDWLSRRFSYVLCGIGQFKIDYHEGFAMWFVRVSVYHLFWAIWYTQTLYSELNLQQFYRLKEAIAVKRPALANRRGLFDQDIAKPHTWIVTRQKLRESYCRPVTDLKLCLFIANDLVGEKIF